MIKITVCKNSLQFCSDMLCVEEQNVTCLSGIVELSFRNCIKFRIESFFHSFQPNFLLFQLIFGYLINPIFPLACFFLILTFQMNILTLALKIENNFSIFLRHNQWNDFNINTTNDFLLFMIFKKEQFLRRQCKVSSFPFKKKRICFLFHISLLQNTIRGMLLILNRIQTSSDLWYLFNWRLFNFYHIKYVLLSVSQLFFQFLNYFLIRL